MEVPPRVPESGAGRRMGARGKGEGNREDLERILGRKRETEMENIFALFLESTFAPEQNKS